MKVPEMKKNLILVNKMLKITLHINQDKICEITATRQEELKNKESIYTYLLNTGELVKHKYSDGVFELVKRIFNKVKISDSTTLSSTTSSTKSSTQ